MGGIGNNAVLLLLIVIMSDGTGKNFCGVNAAPGSVPLSPGGSLLRKNKAALVDETNIALSGKPDDSYKHLMDCMWKGGLSKSTCEKDSDCTWCASLGKPPSICVSVYFSPNVDGAVFSCGTVATPSPTITPEPTAEPTQAYVIVDDFVDDDDDYVPPAEDDDDFVTSAPVTTAPITPAPVTAAPVTAAPVTVAPTPTPEPTKPYDEALWDCLKHGDAKSCKAGCVWCDAKQGGLCFSEAAGKDYEGSHYSCEWKKHGKKHHHHHDHHDDDQKNDGEPDSNPSEEVTVIVQQ